MWVSSTDLVICPKYFLGPPNKVILFFYYSYIHVDIWKFDWSYTPSLLVIIIPHPNIIHRKHCSSVHISLKILYIATLPTHNTSTTQNIRTIHTGVGLFLLSKFPPPMKVSYWRPMS